MNLAKCGNCGRMWDDETESLVCPHPPRVLDGIANKVLTYKPKPKTKAAKRRIRRKKRQLKKRESSI